MSDALLLFAHGARDPEWANPLRRVVACLEARSPGVPVQLAFLEFMSPTMEEGAAALVAAGARRVVILPMFIAQGGHLKREVPALVEALQGRFPDVVFSLAPAIGEAQAVIAAMAEVALARLQGGEEQA